MSNVNPTMTASKAPAVAISQEKTEPSALFPPFALVDPAEYNFLIAQLDGVLRLLAEMLEVTPRLHNDIWARINSVLDERNRLINLAQGKIAQA
jgi:hypothetical protein